MASAAAAAVAATTGEAEETTRLRKPRFSFEENQILIREVRAHYPQLYGAQSRRVSVAERRRVWDGIATKINGISSWKRTGQEVQKRWNDFKRRTKEKLARVPHSTQGTGPAAEDAFSAEEETIFAILGPGVTGPGIEEEPAAASALAAAAATASPQPTAPGAGASRYALSDSRREERRTEAPAHSKGGSSSPQPWARPPSSHAQEGGCPRPKERECPPSAAPQPVQLPRLALSPPPSAPPPLPPTAPAQVALSPPSPPPPPRPPSMSSNPEPSLDFLRAQQETASAIRELADTLRQGLAKLSEALTALLPLLPGTPVEPRASPPLPPPPLPSPPPPPPPGPVLPPPAPKVELSPEPVSVVAAVVDGAVVANQGVIIAPRSEDGAPRPPQATLPPHDSPPHKRRKGFPTRKRRGRWKSP